VQHHQLPVVLVIWDSLFAHFKDLMSYVGYVAGAYIETARDRVLGAQFTEVMSELQNSVIADMCPLLKRAADLYRLDHDPTVGERGFAFSGTFKRGWKSNIACMNRKRPVLMPSSLTYLNRVTLIFHVTFHL
jgi:hypothetical protein